MRALLGQRPRPTAVFCANDLMALGALKACIAARVHVPEAMSIVGCDDIDAAQLVTPELTTVQIRAREMGARAARLLIRRLQAEGGGGTNRQTAPLAVRLMIRHTTGIPGGGG